jgi:hypothetical protein
MSGAPGRQMRMAAQNRSLVEGALGWVSLASKPMAVRTAPFAAANRTVPKSIISMAMMTSKLVFPPPAIPYVSVEQRFRGE